MIRPTLLIMKEIFPSIAPSRLSAAYAPSGDRNSEPAWWKEEWKIQPHDKEAGFSRLKTDPQQALHLVVDNSDKTPELKDLPHRYISSGRSGAPSPAGSHISPNSFPGAVEQVGIQIQNPN
jgi:hypothetical protein